MVINYAYFCEEKSHVNVQGCLSNPWYPFFFTNLHYHVVSATRLCTNIFSIPSLFINYQTNRKSKGQWYNKSKRDVNLAFLCASIENVIIVYSGGGLLWEGIDFNGWLIIMEWIEHSLFQTRSYQVEIPQLQLAAIRQLNKYLSERLEVEQVIYFILIVLTEKTKAGNGPIS